MINIISANTTHIENIRAIELESFSDPWSVASIESEIANKHSICYIALFNPVCTNEHLVVGYVSMRHIINEGHINNIAVSKAYRRHGVGSLLMDTLLKEAIKREMIGLTLEVRVSNQAALSLYKKYGFMIEGYRRNYYSVPTEDGAIMWKNLNEVQE